MVVSVIMSTYNRSKFLTNSIGSVLWQTYPDWKLYVVDDGSTDNTKQVVQSISDKRVHYINKGKQKYYTHVRNIGINESDGELIAFRDDDGCWSKTFLEELVKPHESRDVVLTYCGRIIHNKIKLDHILLEDLEDLKVHEKPPLFQWQGMDSLSNEVDVGDFMIKRSVFNNKDFQGFREEMDNPSYCSDAKLIDDIHKNNRHGKFVMINKRLHHYFYDHGGDQMTIRKIKARERGEMIDEEAWSF